MADDKSQRGEPDRSRVAGDEEYEVDYFAQKHGLTRDHAQELINRHGHNREKLDAEAARIARRQE